MNFQAHRVNDSKFTLTLNGEPTHTELIVTPGPPTGYSVLSENSELSTLLDIYTALATPSEGAQAIHGPRANVTDSVLALKKFNIERIDYDGEEKTILFYMFQPSPSRHFRLKLDIQNGLMTIQVPNNKGSFYMDLLKEIAYNTDFLPIEDYDIQTIAINMLTGHDL